MRKLSLLLMLILTFTVLTQTRPAAADSNGKIRQWPTVEQQLAKDRIRPGSNLEGLVYANQDFDMLRPGEMNDKIGIAPWLRVLWRKAHPELTYAADDPTGGYPRVLHEVHEWMLHHQDLLESIVETDLGPIFENSTAGTNVRTSGAQTSPRSESDIRINFNNPSLVIAASNAIVSGGHQAMFYSSNGGSTWGQTTLPFTTGDAFHSDPTVDWRSTGVAWSTTIGINSTGTQLKMRSYNSSTNGSSWAFDSTFSGTQTSADKQMVWIDHSATSSFKDSIYACWHNGNPAYVNRRTATGAWGTPVTVSGTETTGTAIGCDIKTNSAGDVFVFWPTTTNRRIIMRKSTNGGSTWGTAVIVRTMFDAYDIGIPSFANRRALIYTSAGAYKSATVNNVYVAWTDLTGATGCTSASNEPGTNAASTCKTRIWFSRSTDGGTTWSAATMINNQAGLNDQFNQALAVDESTGRIAVIYYDTVGDSTRKKTNVYYQTSADNGATWSAAVKVTTVQTDETIAGADSGNQYGDYNSLSGWASKFLPSWTDRRSGGKEEIWTAPVTEP
jgi:hypothetical protein